MSRHAQFCGAVGSHRISADACGEKCADKRTDKEDPHDRRERRACTGLDRAEQNDPSVGHQGPIRQDEQDGDSDRPPVGAGGCREDCLGMALHEDVCRQPAGHDQAGQEPQRTTQRRSFVQCHDSDAMLNVAVRARRGQSRNTWWHRDAATAGPDATPPASRR